MAESDKDVLGEANDGTGQQSPKSNSLYYVLAGLAVVVTPVAAMAFGNSSLKNPDLVSLIVWISAAVLGIVCAIQILRLRRSVGRLLFGSLLLFIHSVSMLLLVLVCAGRN